MSETCGCEEVGPMLVAPGTSGRSWTCETCGKVWTRDAQRPYADHPATLVLEAHELSYWSRHGTLAHCTCGATGTSHAAHLAEVLHRAGLLADGPPPVTLTERVLAERADRRSQ